MTLDEEVRKPTALVVDDEVANLELSSTFLGDQGYDIEKAMNGSQAIEKISQNFDLETPYNLIIMDYAMPDKTGSQVLRELESDGKLNESAIVLYSGTDENAVGELPEQVVYQAKPVRFNELAYAINKAYAKVNKEAPESIARITSTFTPKPSGR